MEKDSEHAFLKDLLATIDLRPALNVVAKEILSLGCFDGCTITFANEKGDALVCEQVKLPKGFEGIENIYYNYKFPFDRGDVNVVSYKSAEIIRVTPKNFEDYQGTTRQRYRYWNLKELVIIPFCLPSKAPIGTVSVFTQESSILMDALDSVTDIIECCYSYIESAIKCKRNDIKLKEVANAVEEKRQFLDFVTRVNALKMLDIILDEITERMLAEFGFDMVSVYLERKNQLIHQRTKIQTHEYADDLEAWEMFFRNTPYECDSTEGGIAICYVQNNSLYMDDLEDIKHLTMTEKDGIAMSRLRDARSLLCIPVRHGEKAIGVMTFIKMKYPAKKTPEEIELMILLSSFVGSAIENAKMYNLVEQQKIAIGELNKELSGKVDQLAHSASHDKLTGLNNYASFEAEIVRRVEEQKRMPADIERRESKGLSLVILDIDHFKKLNDTYGHPAGNTVLAEVARQIGDTARKMDIPCRFGGEEFCVILPECGIVGAQEYADRVRQKIESFIFTVAQENNEMLDIQITISGGCAMYRNGEEYSEFVDRADKALYRAKEGGRNQVCSEQS